MTYSLFIDDERFPTDWNNVFIARSSNDAIECVKNKGIPSEIMFDHDLGGSDTVRIFIRWLVDFIQDNDIVLSSEFKYSIHSQNPIGKVWIASMMDAIIVEFSK